MLHEESDEEEAAMVDRAFWDTLKKIGGHVVNAGKTVLGAAGKACKVMKGREEINQEEANMVERGFKDYANKACGFVDTLNGREEIDQKEAIMVAREALDAIYALRKVTSRALRNQDSETEPQVLQVSLLIGGSDKNANQTVYANNFLKKI